MESSGGIQKMENSGGIQKNGKQRGDTKNGKQRGIQKMENSQSPIRYLHYNFTRVCYYIYSMS